MSLAAIDAALVAYLCLLLALMGFAVQQDASRRARRRNAKVLPPDN
tara:strand:+ start:289 stop:426 length:138 start_codon:yes stop_codon:yes gene_type:complete